MNKILLTLMVFGIVGCSSEVVLECEKYRRGSVIVISKDESTLTIIDKDGNQKVYYKASLSRYGVAIYRYDDDSFLRYDTKKKTLISVPGQCKQV